MNTMVTDRAFMVRDACLRFEDIASERIRTYLNECEHEGTEPSEPDFILALLVELDPQDIDWMIAALNRR